MVELITVTPDNVEKTGFFCKMSALGKPGYEQKKAWLAERFAEGLEMRLLGDGERGFVEFIPGKFAWRAIDGADDFMVIHCLWVVGKSKGKGFGTVLLEEVERTAREHGFKGVAALTSGHTWLMGPDLLAGHAYESVEKAEPSFDLMVKRFADDAGMPRLSGRWAQKAEAIPEGLGVFRTDQCPYTDDAVKAVQARAKAKGLKFSEITLTTAQDIRERSPTPYGTYAVVKDGKLLTYTYLLPRDFDKLGI